MRIGSCEGVKYLLPCPILWTAHQFEGQKKYFHIFPQSFSRGAPRVASLPVARMVIQHYRILEYTKVDSNIGEYAYVSIRSSHGYSYGTDSGSNYQRSVCGMHACHYKW